jgi:hypothetical protein
MSEWITDRLPTRNDVESIYDFVWLTKEDGEVTMRHWSNIVEGQPWQVFRKPAPYVKPKRWAVEWSATAKRYSLWFDGHYCHTMPKSCNYKAAKEIEHIYNQVMP